ncbi:SH3 domain-containing protein [Candidatus Dactylopiibacterium carminicum]|uniref:SH3 domain-containing protein n=1 Tax=Candidatus Dactylopiibacterium carminicum TaxID=857335 RepID=UPI001CC28056|nr:SH3 domain-containing protein [Candidatus Dactylopiibacterium carminicum]
MIKRICFLLSLLAAPLAAQAFDYKNVTEHAIVYDAGSTKATSLFILRRGTPVEVIVSINRWVKVREASGGLGWVESSQLGDARQVIVTEARASLRESPDENAPEVLVVGRDVLLEVLESPAGSWLKVRHQDGQAGFISIRSIWGI